MAEYNNQADEHWTPFKHPRFTLWGDKWPAGKGTPTAQLLITKAGNTKFTIYRNDGIVSGGIDFTLGDPASPLNAFIFFDELEKAVKSTEHGIQTAYQIKSWFAGGQQRLEKAKTMHTVAIMRDDRGRICLSFQRRNEDPIVIPFKLPDTFGPLTPSAEKISEKEESEIMALGWVALLRHTAGAFIATQLQKPKPRPNNNGGGNNYGGGGGNNSQSSSFQSNNSNSGGFSDFDDVD